MRRNEGGEWRNNTRAKKRILLCAWGFVQVCFFSNMMHRLENCLHWSGYYGRITVQIFPRMRKNSLNGSKVRWMASNLIAKRMSKNCDKSIQYNGVYGCGCDNVIILCYSLECYSSNVSKSGVSLDHKIASNIKIFETNFKVFIVWKFGFLKWF